MTFAKTVTGYEARLRRVESLTSSHTPAAEILAFYREILSFQKNLSMQLARSTTGQSATFESGQRGDLDHSAVLPDFRGFLATVQSKGPPVLAASARQIAGLPSEAWVALL